MSDSWYRDPPTIPSYEDYAGTLWTWDGQCLNPVQGCEPPQWYHDLRAAELHADLVMWLSAPLDEATGGEV